MYNSNNQHTIYGGKTFKNKKKDIGKGMTHRLEKRDDNLEKKEVREEGSNPKESASAVPP